MTPTPAQRIGAMLADALGPCPETGVHDNLWRAASWLAPKEPWLCWGDSLLIDSIVAWVGSAGATRRTPADLKREAAEAWRNASAPRDNSVTVQGPDGAPVVMRRGKWEDPDPEAITRTHAERRGRADDWAAKSPIQFPAGQAEAAELCIDLLFGRGDFDLTIGPDVRTAFTRPREQFRGREHTFQHIVPSYPVAREGKKAGWRAGDPLSKRCLEMFPTRRFLVCDFDPPKDADGNYTAAGALLRDFDVQTSCILHLADLLPLAAVVFSGSKSLHAWFNVAGTPEVELWPFMTAARKVGADPLPFTRCSWVRLPFGTRKPKPGNPAAPVPQPCRYLNPANIPAFAGVTHGNA